jgi:hypothetical protein
VPDVFAAASYGDAALPADPRPEVVRDNWGEETVRRIWQTDGLVTAAKLRVIEHYLAELDAATAGRRTGAPA